MHAWSELRPCSAMQPKETKMVKQHPMTNVQLELLKIYSTDIPDDELFEMKNMLAKFFANKAIKAANNVWDEKNLTNDVMNEWLDEK